MIASNKSISSEFRYKTKARSQDNWRGHDRVRLGISVGMPYHEGQKLAAALDWAQRHFRHIEIRVSDTLQRYNMPGLPEENRNTARMLGDEWLDRNAHILRAVPQAMIYRWDDLLNDTSYPAYHAQMAERMKDPAFLQAMETDVKAFTVRTGRNGQTCFDYLQEELAAFSLLQDKRPAVEAYPGSFLECRRLLREDFVLCRLHFERRPLLQQDVAA